MLAPFGFGLHTCLMGPLAGALCVVARKSVGGDMGFGRDLAVGECLQCRLIVVVGVGETHPTVGFWRHHHQLFVWTALAAPAGLDPIVAAVLPGRKPRLELHRRFWKITPQAVVVVARHGPPPG